jgi:N-methylhydantoinase B
MAVLSPIFYQGEWVGFAANLAHKSDIGGPVPGSCWSQAREIYQEGLHVPPIKYVQDYKTSKDIEALLGCNSRTPELVVGDLRGQVGAARLGEKRFQEMMERYGKDTILDSFEELFSLTEAKVRTEIASWPDGIGEGERFVDSDGVELDKPVRLHVRIEKKGARLLFDLTGSADQTKGPANIRPTIVRAACCYLLTCLVDPALAINYGLAKCIDIKVREGSVVNPRFPAPVNTYNPTVHALVESLLEASSQITPHKKVGDGCSSRSIIIGGRSNKTGKGYVQYEIFGGGSGGRSGKDGVSGTNVNQSNAKIAPIEIIEAEFATRVKRFELIADSGGPGQFRGGLGFVREYEVLDNDARFSLRSTKHTVAPKGIDGGLDGKTGLCTLNPGQPEERVIPSRYSDHVLHPGEVFSLETPGGGGLGNPLERDPSRVLNDVRNGYVTVQRAREVYRVSIEPVDGDFVLNEPQTRELRAQATGKEYESI